MCLLRGCATVIKGYYSKVELKDAPDSLQVFATEGVELPVTKTNPRVQIETVPHNCVDKPASLIGLRSRYDHALALRYQGQGKRYKRLDKLAVDGCL